MTSSRVTLLRDRDAIFGDAFREQVRDMGMREVLSTPRSPWQRAYVERVIGSIRRECLDHVIVLHESSLRRTLDSYFFVSLLLLLLLHFHLLLRRPVLLCSTTSVICPPIMPVIE